MLKEFIEKGISLSTPITISSINTSAISTEDINNAGLNISS